MREKAAAVETIPAWTQLFRRVARSAVSTWKGVRLVWQADRLRASVLFVLYSLQAILGISAAYLSKLVIDALFYPSTVVLSPMIPAVAFVVVSLALDTLPVFIGSQQNLFTATLRAYIDTRLMEKANRPPSGLSQETAGCGKTLLAMQGRRCCTREPHFDPRNLGESPARNERRRLLPGTSVGACSCLGNDPSRKRA